MKSGTFFAVLFFCVAPGVALLLLWRGIMRALRETHRRSRIALALSCYMPCRFCMESGQKPHWARPRLSDFVIPALWLSLPVAIVLAQLRRQALLGWFLLFAGFTLVAEHSVYPECVLSVQ